MPTLPGENARDRRPAATVNPIAHLDDALRKELERKSKWLNANAKRIFNDTAAELFSIGLINKSDISSIALYAFQCDRLEKQSKKTGEERSEKLLTDLVSSILTLGRELGITPTGRAKLRIQSKTEIAKSIVDIVDEDQ